MTKPLLNLKDIGSAGMNESFPMEELASNESPFILNKIPNVKLGTLSKRPPYRDFGSSMGNDYRVYGMYEIYGNISESKIKIRFGGDGSSRKMQYTYNSTWADIHNPDTIDFPLANIATTGFVDGIGRMYFLQGTSVNYIQEETVSLVEKPKAYEGATLDAIGSCIFYSAGRLYVCGFNGATISEVCKSNSFVYSEFNSHQFWKDGEVDLDGSTNIELLKEAIVGGIDFNSRPYFWTSNQMYRFDPDTVTLDVIGNVGLAGPNACCVVPFTNELIFLTPHGHLYRYKEVFDAPKPYENSVYPEAADNFFKYFTRTALADGDTRRITMVGYEDKAFISFTNDTDGVSTNNYVALGKNTSNTDLSLTGPVIVFYSSLNSFYLWDNIDALSWLVSDNKLYFGTIEGETKYFLDLLYYKDIATSIFFDEAVSGDANIHSFYDTPVLYMDSITSEKVVSSIFVYLYRTYGSTAKYVKIYVNKNNEGFELISNGDGTSGLIPNQTLPIPLTTDDAIVGNEVVPKRISIPSLTDCRTVQFRFENNDNVNMHIKEIGIYGEIITDRLANLN